MLKHVQMMFCLFRFLNFRKCFFGNLTWNLGFCNLDLGFLRLKLANVLINGFSYDVDNFPLFNFLFFIPEFLGPKIGGIFGIFGFDTSLITGGTIVGFDCDVDDDVDVVLLLLVNDIIKYFLCTYVMF